MTAEASAVARTEFNAILNSDPDATLEKLRDGLGRIVLNADDLFQQYPPYREDFEARKVLGPVLYGVAKDFTNRVYLRLLSQPVGENNTVVFTAGGGASGKSTVLRAQADQAGVEFVVDTTFSTLDRAQWQVAVALEVGRRIDINYVYRPFEDCVRGMLERALNPKNGRVVPIDDLARTHWGAQRTVVEVWARHFDNTNVTVQLWENVGIDRVQATSFAVFSQRLHPSIDKLKSKGQAVLDAIYKKEDSEWKGESIASSLYQAACSQTQRNVKGDQRTVD